MKIMQLYLLSGSYVSISKNDYILRGSIKKDGDFYVFEFTHQAFSLWDNEGTISETIQLNTNTKIKMKYTENEETEFEIISIDTSEEQLKDLKTGYVFKSTGGGL